MSPEFVPDTMQGAMVMTCIIVSGLGFDPALDPVAPLAMYRSEVKDTVRYESHNKTKPAHIQITNDLGPT